MAQRHALCPECHGNRGFYEPGPSGIWTTCDVCGGDGLDHGDEPRNPWLASAQAARRERECRDAFLERVA